VVLHIRVKIPFAEKVYGVAGGREGFAEWMHALLEAAVAGKAPGVGALQAQGYREGKRQGWVAANAVFRKALEAAAAELRK